jgi:glycine betaine/choline ABC-type transport system substrate-binding protein
MRGLQRRLLTSITDKDIKKASAQARITTLAILEDKIRMMEGKATEHIAHQHYQQLDPESMEAIKQLSQKMTQKKLEAVNYDK